MYVSDLCSAGMSAHNKAGRACLQLQRQKNGAGMVCYGCDPTCHFLWTNSLQLHKIPLGGGPSDRNFSGILSREIQTSMSH
mmetsp:Transcript_780/g.1620  ORF Transcript_780/g.1620 Transcript_780/m.1620 type:complete len:81 (+) Transcript_780:895-1137(+)